MDEANGGPDAMLVTVLLVVHDEERFIDEALRSIRGQTYESLEILVVDDGSTDATATIVERHQHEDPRIVLHRRPRGGRVAALNHGIMAARGGLIALMDGDDRCHPERVRRQVERLVAEPGVALVSCAIAPIGADGSPLPTSVNDAAGPTGAAANSTMTARTAVLRAHPYREAFPNAEDYDLFARLKQSGHGMAHLEERLYEYRMNPAGTSSVGREVQIASTINAKISAALRRSGAADPFTDEPRPQVVTVRWDRCPPDVRPALEARWHRMRLELLSLRDRGGRRLAAESFCWLTANGRPLGALRVRVVRMFVAALLDRDLVVLRRTAGCLLRRR